MVAVSKALIGGGGGGRGEAFWKRYTVKLNLSSSAMKNGSSSSRCIVRLQDLEL
jgi:hypothetical protein